MIYFALTLNRLFWTYPWHCNLTVSECTFIIADKVILQETKKETEAMIGDVNLFLRRDDGKNIGEISIMIAEKFGRRQGKGFEALCHMLNYGER